MTYLFSRSITLIFRQSFDLSSLLIIHDFHNGRRRAGVTTSRATSGGRRKDQNTSGQRGNKVNNSYRDISVTVAENNSVVMPKYQQYTSLNKMLSNFSKVFMAHISFYCSNKQWRHRKRHRWHPERHQEELYLRFVTCCVTKKENQNRGPQMNSPTLPQKIFKFFFPCSYS